MVAFPLTPTLMGFQGEKMNGLVIVSCWQISQVEFSGALQIKCLLKNIVLNLPRAFSIPTGFDCSCRKMLNVGRNNEVP